MTVTTHERFNLRTLDDLRDKLQVLGIEIPLSEDLSVLTDEVRLGRLTAWNRLAVHPMEVRLPPDGA